MKRIAIFGSTGSIGRQALEVIAAFPDRFSARLLLAGSNAPLLQEQIGRFLPETAGLAFPPAGYARPAVARFLQGPDALEQACELDGYDAALVILDAIKNVGPDRAAIQEYLSTLEGLEGATGINSFDENGDVIKDPMRMTIEDGQFVVIE